jgi:hypothetical protein
MMLRIDETNKTAQPEGIPDTKKEFFSSFTSLIKIKVIVKAEPQKIQIPKMS